MTLVHSPSAHTQPGTVKTVADILTAAADLIEKPGAWTQGALARHANGNPVGPAEANATCWCLYGALDRVTGVRCYEGAAADVLAGMLPGTVSGWNDRTGRTQAEVVAALRAAADKARTAAETGSVGTKASAEVNQKDTPA